MRELNEGEVEELTSGGECHLHTHPSFLTRRDIDAYQAALAIRSTNGNYTANSDVDDIIVVDTAGGSLTVTLPTRRGKKEFIIVKANALNTLTVNFSNGDLCLGQASFAITALGGTLRFKADLTRWILI